MDPVDAGQWIAVLVRKKKSKSSIAQQLCGKEITNSDKKHIHFGILTT